MKERRRKRGSRERHIIGLVGDWRERSRGGGKVGRGGV